MGTGNNYGSLLGLLPSNTASNGLTNGTQVNTNQFDATSKATLDTALTSNDYSKGNAVADAQTAMDAAVKSALEQGSPQIDSAAKASGGYDSTTQQMMHDDLTARAAAAGSQVVLGNISNYANARANTVGADVAAVNATKGTASTTSGVTQQQAGSKGGVGNLINPAANAGTVICTQLYNDGHLSLKVYNADNKYVRMHFCSATVNGYRAWAVPFVFLMRKNKLIYALGKYIGVKWSEHCAAHFIRDVPKNRVGAVVMWVMVPICYFLGSILPDVEYMRLYKNVDKSAANT